MLLWFHISYFNHYCLMNIHLTTVFPYHIYKYLLISCFPSPEVYVRFLIYGFSIEDNILDKSTSNFVEILLENNIDFCLRNFLTCYYSSSEVNLLKASAIQCVLLLTVNNKFIHLLSSSKIFLHSTFPRPIYSFLRNRYKNLNTTEIPYFLVKHMNKLQRYSHSSYT
ncbi:hypothetical protein HZS_7269 [Henneguya salminicola]|nr:hypothetical protein HZS_7269 [Henneguya salminicola]